MPIDILYQKVMGLKTKMDKRQMENSKLNHKYRIGPNKLIILNNIKMNSQTKKIKKIKDFRKNKKCDI